MAHKLRNIAVKNERQRDYEREPDFLLEDTSLGKLLSILLPCIATVISAIFFTNVLSFESQHMQREMFLVIILDKKDDYVIKAKKKTYQTIPKRLLKWVEHHDSC